MSEATITHLPDPSGFSTDPLTDLVRDGARQLIRQAVEAELAALLERHAAEKLEDGSAHFWAREMEALGQEVKLIAPQYVRPFVKRQKMMRPMLRRLSLRHASLRCVSWSPKQSSSSLARRSSAAGNA